METRKEFKGAVSSVSLTPEQGGAGGEITNGHPIKRATRLETAPYELLHKPDRLPFLLPAEPGGRALSPPLSACVARTRPTCLSPLCSLLESHFASPRPTPSAQPGRDESARFIQTRCSVSSTPPHSPWKHFRGQRATPAPTTGPVFRCCIDSQSYNSSWES